MLAEGRRPSPGRMLTATSAVCAFAGIQTGILQLPYAILTLYADRHSKTLNDTACNR